MNYFRNTPLFRLLLCSVILMLHTSVSAQIPLLASEQSDHPLLTRFPDSEIVEAEFRENINHMLVLGSLQRTREEVIPENSERIRGNVTKLLYQIPQEYSGVDVYRFFTEQMDEKSYVQLFNCEGRACGSSNYWANDIFRNRILYGPERNQYYLAMRTDFGIEQEPRISLYIITRANRRIYAYVEIIETGGALPPINVIQTDAVFSLLQENGSVVLPGIRFTEDDQLSPETNLDYLVELLQSEPGLRVYLVGHLQGGESLSRLQQRSATRANVLRQELVSQGIAAERLQAEGVGPLAPNCSVSECRERIEMVLQ